MSTSNLHARRYRRARDPELLDALDAHKRTTFTGIVWRVAREGRNPLEPSHAGGRWDLGGNDGYDVLYTALEPDGAIAEVAYHRSLQPVVPFSRPMRYCIKFRFKRRRFFELKRSISL